MEELVDFYLKDKALNWSNTLGTNKGVPNSSLGATDLFASFCFRLKRNYGGSAFINNLWKEVDKRPIAITTQDAVDNFFLSACAAAKRDLGPVFLQWKWVISQKALTDANHFPK